VEGVADVREQLATFSGEEEASSEEVTGGAHLRWIDVGLRNHAPTEQHDELLGVDAIILGLRAVDGLQVEGVGQDEGDVVLGAEIREPVPAEDALGADHEVIGVGRDGLEEGLGRAVDSIVEQDSTLVVGETEVHRASMEIDTAVVAVAAAIEAHEVPSWSEWMRRLAPDILPVRQGQVQEGPR